MSLLANGYGQKFQFRTEHERVKFMVFQVPSTWSFNFDTVITVEGLSEHSYPSIYLTKLELEDIPEDFELLVYPTLVDYDLKFGDNFSYQLYSDKVSRFQSI